MLELLPTALFYISLEGELKRAGFLLSVSMSNKLDDIKRLGKKTAMDQMFSCCWRGLVSRLQSVRKGLIGEEVKCGPLS